MLRHLVLKSVRVCHKSIWITLDVITENCLSLVPRCFLMIIVMNMVRILLNLVSEIEKYIGDHSAVTLETLEHTLAYYFLYIKGEEPYLTGFHGLDKLPSLKLAAMLQTALYLHYDDIHRR